MHSGGPDTAEVGASRGVPTALWRLHPCRSPAHSPPRSPALRSPPSSPGAVRAATAAARPPPRRPRAPPRAARSPPRPRTTRSPRRSRRASSADGKIVFGTDASYPPNEFTGAGRHHDRRHGRRPGHRRRAEARAHRRVPEQRLPRHHPGHPGRQVRAGHVVVLGQPRARADRRHGQLLQRRHQRGRKSGNPDNINADDLCGKAVGVQAGTVQVDDVAARNQKCTPRASPRSR